VLLPILKCLDPVLTMAAALSYRDPFVLTIQYERERAQQARQRLANGSQSDMLSLLNAFHGYTWAMQNKGMRGAGDFCRQHFLSITTMQMMEKLKVQYMDTLKVRRSHEHDTASTLQRHTLSIFSPFLLSTRALMIPHTNSSFQQLMIIDRAPAVG
jgi:HrpA-like RNA helicase